MTMLVCVSFNYIILCLLAVLVVVNVCKILQCKCLYYSIRVLICDVLVEIVNWFICFVQVGYEKV